MHLTALVLERRRRQPDAVVPDRDLADRVVESALRTGRRRRPGPLLAAALREIDAYIILIAVGNALTSPTPPTKYALLVSHANVSGAASRMMPRSVQVAP
jgi:hypothetical protein